MFAEVGQTQHALRDWQLERLELDSVVSVPLVDRTFFVGDETLGADPFSARVGLVALRGNFTVASSVKLINTISVDIRDHDVVIFDFSETVYMDDSAALVVEQLIAVAVAENTDCVMMGLEGLPATALQGLNALSGVPADHIVADLDGARGIARRLLLEA